MRCPRAGLFLLALAACGKDPKPAPAPPPEPKQVVLTKAPKLVDLLRFNPSVVAVSSKVDNPKDFPEHIVDGKPETAWNGKTGDLVNGWIAFRVPADTTVKRIELTAGYDKNDLFTMNHRIARVRISRAGKVLKEAKLDPNDRGMQAIDLEEAGGDFEIRVLETVPGSRADYKELCVSEIAVLGLPGATRFDAPVLPRVFVGSLEGPSSVERPTGAHPSVAAAGPYSTPDAFCDAQKKAAAPGLARLYGNGERYPGKIDPWCTTGKIDKATRVKLAPPFLEAMQYSANEPELEVGGILLRTDRGWFRTPWIMWSREHGDPGCLHIARVQGVVLESPDEHVPLAWMRIIDSDTNWMMMHPTADGGFEAASWTDWSERLEVCRVEAGTGVLACDKTLVLDKAKADEGDPDYFTRHPKPPFPPRQVRLGDGGLVELLQ